MSASILFWSYWCCYLQNLEVPTWYYLFMKWENRNQLYGMSRSTFIWTILGILESCTSLENDKIIDTGVDADALAYHVLVMAGDE